MKPPVLELQNLSTGYVQKRGVPQIISENLSLHLHKGEVVSLIGPNGVGKSTLFRTIAGVQPPLGGQVLLKGSSIESFGLRERAKQISLVFTGRPQVGLITVESLVSLGRYPHTGQRGRLSSVDQEQITRAMELTGVLEFRSRYADELSDGELQRVMIARAVAQDTDIMILDEPAAFLDVGHRIELMGLLHHIASTTDRAILLSSHDLELVYHSSHVVWLMEKGGCVSQGTPEDLMNHRRLSEVFLHEKSHPLQLKESHGEGVSLYQIYRYGREHSEEVR